PRRACAFATHRTSRRISNYRKTAGPSRPTICTKAGATSFTGIRCSIRPEARKRRPSSRFVPVAEGLTRRVQSLYSRALFPRTRAGPKRGRPRPEIPGPIGTTTTENERTYDQTPAIQIQDQPPLGRQPLGPPEK